MKRIIPILILAVAALAIVPGCRGAAATTLTVAQAALEPYSFHVKGDATQMVLGVNPRYLAIDAKVDALVQFRGPQDDVLGAPIVVRWEKHVQKGPGKRVYKAVFSSQGKFVTVVPATWAEARASMPFLPPEG